MKSFRIITVLLWSVGMASLALVSAVGCKSKHVQWEGVPEVRVCSTTATGTATCIADGKVYHCVPNGTRNMLCARLTADIVCTKVLNVETACPSKP